MSREDKLERDLRQRLKDQSLMNVSTGQTGKEGLVYVDRTTLATAPVPDYYRLYVTDKNVRLMRWPMRVGPIPPLQDLNEKKVELKEFKDHTRFASAIARIFGDSVVAYLNGLSNGHYDAIVRLPDKPLAKIMEYVGIESLDKLAPVCKRFHEVATGNTLWESLCASFSPSAPGYDIPFAEKHCKIFGWRAVFLAFHLQDKIFPEKKMRLGSVNAKRTPVMVKAVDAAGEGVVPYFVSQLPPAPTEQVNTYQAMMFKNPSPVNQSLRDLIHHNNMADMAMMYGRRPPPSTVKDAEPTISYASVVKDSERLSLRPILGPQATRSKQSRSLQDVPGSSNGTDKTGRQNN